LGEKLRKIRTAANLTQLDVANKSGMHVNYYARIERGEENPSFEKLQSIMKILKIKSLDLL
jgi:transcriptional regulator with XRE-family HTH domain